MYNLDINGQQFIVELMELRHNKTSTVFCAQYSVKDWYAKLGETTLTELLLDHIVYNMIEIDMGINNFIEKIKIYASYDDIITGIFKINLIAKKRGIKIGLIIYVSSCLIFTHFNIVENDWIFLISSKYYRLPSIISTFFCGYILKLNGNVYATVVVTYHATPDNFDCE